MNNKSQVPTAQAEVDTRRLLELDTRNEKLPVTTERATERKCVRWYEGYRSGYFC